jgi:hypothetical protein
MRLVTRTGSSEYVVGHRRVKAGLKAGPRARHI